MSNVDWNSVMLKHGRHRFSPLIDNFRGSGIRPSILNYDVFLSQNHTTVA